MRLGLKRKIVAAIVGAGVLPLLLGMLLAYSQSTTELERVIGGNFAALAGEAARSIDLVLAGEVARRQRLAGNDQLMRLLEWHAGPRRGAARSSEGTRGDVRDTLRRFARTQGLEPDSPEPSPLRALFLTDNLGSVLESVGPPGYPPAAVPAWRRDNGGDEGAGLSVLAFDAILDTYTFTLSVPIFDRDHRRLLGVLHSVYDAQAFFRPIIHSVRFGKTGHVMLIDARGTVITCPILPTGVRVTDPSLVRSVTANIAGWVKAHGDGHGSASTSIIGFSPLVETGQLAQRLGQPIWHSFAWQASEEIFAPTHSLLQWMAAAGVLALGLLAVLGWYAAHRIIAPIERLQDGAARIGRGELTENLEIRTGDEIEQLAAEFNRMNRRLQRSFAGLEEQVAAKTAEVLYLKEYTETILNSLPDAVMILGASGGIEYANAAAMRDFSLDGTSLVGRTLFSVFAVPPSVERELVAGIAGTLDKGPEPRSTIGFSPRDPLAPLPTGRAVPEMRFNGRIYRYGAFRLTAAGNSTGTGIVLRDVTSERLLQDELIQAEKLAGFGTLTAGIAHEINNPLFVVMALAESIEDDVDVAPAAEKAREIAHYAKHMASIIKTFSRYTTPGTTDALGAVNVNEKLAEAVKMGQLADDTGGLEIETSYQPLPPVMARPEELQQVFMNIILNAVQAMNGRGHLRIETDAPDGMVRVRIADTGPGIPKAYLSKIFDPFFTTKEPGKGTGLGLNIVYQIVTKYGGTVSVTSEEGHGAEFTIQWPAMVAVV
jgi:signal transduction histidine kinase